MYRCQECKGEFAKYGRPGQCPLCGDWLMITCVECGYVGAASFYLDLGQKCPKCGRKTELPGGADGTRLMLAGLIGVGLVVVAVIVRLITG